MVVMGRVAGAQGILGWVKLRAYTGFVDSLAEFPAWWLGEGKSPWRKVNVEKIAVQSKGLVAKFPDCNDRATAEKFKGLLVAVPRSQLPKAPEDEYYWFDLIGMEVISLEGKHLGRVDNLMETGANQVLCVKNDDGEMLIPFIASAVQQVSLEKKLIMVDWSDDWAGKH